MKIETTHIFLNDQILIQILASSMDVLLKTIKQLKKQSSRKGCKINK